MPTMHNKKRYQRHEKNRPEIIATGRSFLQYHHEDEEIDAAKKGDFRVHPSVEQLHTIRQGEYGRTGYAGYFRVDISDGRAWCPVLLTELFPDREHHFSKSECPIDTYAIVEEILRALKDRAFMRTYREHYELKEIE